MKPYRNLSKESGIRAFEIREDAIVVEFEGRTIYLYNYTRPGKIHVETMKKLAESGEGLATYINKWVRENYFKKLA